MYVGVIHTIRDADAWAGMMRSVAPDSFPAGLELLATATSADVDRAICLWRAPGVEQLQSTLDQLAGQFAVNDCFAVSDEFTQIAGQASQAASV
ncbi:hypothetical protein [Modestobacter sp. I12A-02662]|uniref:hypothetical protein n=1 Tax=Modestobacter sp. I12A-02662 TaxID=1730496 RepID=UPI0034DED08A